MPISHRGNHSVILGVTVSYSLDKAQIIYLDTPKRLSGDPVLMLRGIIFNGCAVKHVLMGILADCPKMAKL